jgi:hypothetical protein
LEKLPREQKWYALIIVFGRILGTRNYIIIILNIVDLQYGFVGFKKYIQLIPFCARAQA